MNRPLPFSYAWVWAVTLILGSAVCLHAAETPLTQLVSDDAGLCIEGQDLKRHVAAWLKSDSAARFQELSFYRVWRAGDEFKKLTAVRGVLENVLNRPPEAWAGELFGRSLLVALYPRENAAPAAVLLIEAENAEVVQATIQAWNRVEQQQTVELAHRDVTYFSRTPRRGGNETDKRMYYWFDGTLFAIAEEQEMIHRVIELKLQRDDGEVGPLQPLAESAAYRRAMNSLSDESIVSVYFNPHAWDRSGLAETPNQFTPLFDLLRRTNSVAAGVHWNSGLIVEAVLHHEPHESSSDFWGELAAESTDWPRAAEHAPAETLLLIAGSNEWSLLLREVANMPEVLRQRDVQDFRTALKTLLLGRDLFDDVLPLLPPRWGLFVVAHDAAVPGESPLQALWMLALPPEISQTAASSIATSTPAANSTDEMRDALENLLQTSANLFAVYLNIAVRPEPPLITHSETIGSAPLVWLDRIAGYQPAYAFTENALWISSSLDLLKRRLNAATGDHHQLRDEWSRWSDEYLASADFLVLLRVARLREALETHRERLLDIATANDPDRRDPLRDKLMTLHEALQLVDGVFASADWGTEETRFTLGFVLQSGSEQRVSQAE